jgi:hypothetical protein
MSPQAEGRPTDASVSRWLIVVRRDKPTLYHDLSRAFQTTPQVAVILDRRVAARGERPATQKRTPLTASELELWETVGFRLIPPPILVLQDNPSD